MILFFHFAYVCFVAFGMMAVLIGYLCKWKWIHNPWFRFTHLGMILIVVVESLLQIECPLTTWENYLREQSGQLVRHGTFMAEMVSRVMFVSVDHMTMTVIYCIFFSCVVLTFFIAPPLERSQVS